MAARLTPDRSSRSRWEAPDNPGLSEVPGHGYIDWAGRRLFLPDGSPDPETPGAYRYQTRPDLCDIEAPDSDPASPRYEPPHLRHRPGDTFEIGGKPHDPDDPGPYGTPGWYQDRRTGRHRRSELPDPIPPWEPPQATATAPEPQLEPALPAPPERPSPGPYRRRAWTDEPAAEEPYRFSRLREDAWDRWLIDSAPLARAHQTTHTAAERDSSRTITALARLLKWVIAVIKGPKTTAHGPGPAPEETPNLRTIPPNRPAPHPRSEPASITAWERHFDALHPATGGAAL